MCWRQQDVRWLLWKWREAALEHLGTQEHHIQPGVVRKADSQLKKADANEGADEQRAEGAVHAEGAAQRDMTKDDPSADEQHAEGSVPRDMTKDDSSVPDGLRQRFVLAADSSGSGTATHTHAARTSADEVAASAPRPDAPRAKAQSPLQAIQLTSWISHLQFLSHLLRSWMSKSIPNRCLVVSDLHVVLSDCQTARS